MPELQASVPIDRPRREVLATLQDLTAMRAYMPGLIQVQLTSDVAQGVGATRHCKFEGGVELHERVITWEADQGYTLETTAFKGVPMKSNLITFAVTGNDTSATVTQTMRYEMKGGPFAPLLGWMARGRMQQALQGALDGLKAYLEQHRTAPPA